ncbi:MAG: response regulator [Bdellovibrionales bacterium]
MTNGIRSQRILLVEDSVDDYEATSRAFKKASLLNPLTWVQSGEEALKYLRHEGKYAQDPTCEKPGLILLDLNMPGLDGRKVLRLIKDDPEHRCIPVVILTTSNDERDVKTCYEYGASTYIQKPVSFDGLIQSIKGLKEYWFEIAILPKEKQDE